MSKRPENFPPRGPVSRTSGAQGAPKLDDLEGEPILDPSVGAAIIRFPEAAAAEMRAVAERRPLTLSSKRVADLVLATIALAILLVPMLITAAIIRLSSKGPAIFRQKRTGLNGATFTILKFRTMYVDKQDVSGVRHTVLDDPRVTSIGRVLRKYSIDELPQLLNVLRGDMSIVGPRAHAVGMLALGVPYAQFVKDYELRHLVRPGITGQAQVRGFRGEVSDEAHARGRIEQDLDYVRNVSIWRDLRIIVATVPAVVSGRAAF